MAAKKKAVAKTVATPAVKKEGYALVRPDHIYISKAVNGYTIDPDLKGGAVWVAKDEKELAEQIKILFSGIPAKKLQPDLEEIIDEE